MAETLEAKAANDKRLAGILERIAKDRKAYEPLINSAEERSIYQNWASAWDKYITGVQDVIELSRGSIGRIPTEASEAISKKVAVIAAESDAFLEKGINLNNTGADTATREAAEGYNSSFWLVLGIVAAVVICGVGVGMYLVRDLSNGIASVVKPMQALGSGDLTAEVTRRGEKTEIGAMADALQVFKDALIAKKAADEAAARDAEAKIERGRRVDGITRDFEAMIGEIVETVSSASTELEASASTLTATAERAQELATTVAAASEEASTNVQSVASATEEMASSVTEISRQVQESARMAGDAVDQASRTNDRVGELSKAAARIGDVVELINNIAGQTNLLALNATIEAARAGEAGRGFAVVASEVKALAEQTAKATGEIGQQITGIQAATQDSVSAIQEISGTIGKLSEISSAIAAAVEEQGAATQEISRNVQQAAQGTQMVSANITDVQRGASETETASSHVLSAAQSLSGTATASRSRSPNSSNRCAPPERSTCGGDVRMAIPGLGRRDEIGEMAGAVEVFKTNMIEAERLRGEQREAEARQAEQRKADMRELANAFEGAVGEIVETVSSASTELEASADTLTKAAERSQSLATTVAAASEEASTNVQSVSSASEELTISVNEISRQVQESSRVASEAVDQAQKTNGRVSELSKAASRIGDVVELINTIAGQTNLLALERHDRGRARRRGWPRLRGRRIRGQGARRADREGDRRDQSADIGHPGRDPGFGCGDQGDRRHHRPDVGDFLDHCRRRGRAGRGHAGDLPQYPACRNRHAAGLLQHHGRAARRDRDRIGLRAGSFGGEIAVERKQPAQARGQQIPQLGQGRLSDQPSCRRSRRDLRRRLPAEQDPLVQPADRHQHQAEAHERQRAIDARERRHVDQEGFQDRQCDDDRRRQPRTLRVEENADAEQYDAERQIRDRVGVLLGAGGRSARP